MTYLGAMARQGGAPHGDTLDEALPHFNEEFRHRFWLPPLTLAYVNAVSGSDPLFEHVQEVRAERVADASCAILARIALATVPRYAIGLVTADGRAHFVGPAVPEEEPFLRGQVLLVNPLGGYDNWADMSRFFHETVGEADRRRTLAGLASELRRDYKLIDPLLRAGGPHGAAVAMPPSEGFSASRAAEVAFIYEVSIETLRLWRRKYRAERSSGKPGAPRKNR
jgi:hypothetical protein